MKYILVIWFTLVNGQQGASVSEWDTRAACEEAKAIMVTDMHKGMDHGRWANQVHRFNAECFELDTIET